MIFCRPFFARPQSARIAAAKGGERTPPRAGVCPPQVAGARSAARRVRGGMTRSGAGAGVPALPEPPAQQRQAELDRHRTTECTPYFFRATQCAPTFRLGIHFDLR